MSHPHASSSPGEGQSVGSLVWKIPFASIRENKILLKKAFPTEVRRRAEQILWGFFHTNTKDKPFKQLVNSVVQLQGTLRLLQVLNSGQSRGRDAVRSGEGKQHRNA